jgi:carboxypeptidase C (cathepsin A)
MFIISQSFLKLATLTMLFAVSSFSTDFREDGAVVTPHDARISGQLLQYSAEVGRVAIRDVETGEPHGYMFYTAYRLKSAEQSRPVTFLWNGGPGADSALLHFLAAGPKLLQNAQLVDNPDSWLPATDLVFVDPIGTGFSRPAKAEYGTEFYGTVGDVASVTEFIRCWRVIHSAEDAPIFLVGESWGAGRAANVAYALEKHGINVNGLVLISGGWGLTKQYISPQLLSALHVVDMASTALYYEKTAADLGKDRNQIRQSAETWARNSYAPALERRDSLSEQERTAIIAQLVRFTGIPAAQINRETLVISPRQFRTALLGDEHKELYIFDMRRTAAPNVLDAKSILHYFRHDLAYRSDLLYIGLEDVHQGYAPNGNYPESVNERWNYATAKLTPEEVKAAIEAASAGGEGPPRLGPPLPGTEDAFALNPHMNVLVAGGMYDSFLPCAVGKEIERQLPSALRASMTFKCYLGGHSMYADPSMRSELSHDVMELVKARK